MIFIYHNQHSLTVSSLQTNMKIFAKSVDPDQTAHNELSQEDLHCLPFCNYFLSETPIQNNESVQIQRWKSLLQNSGVKG